jgi:hypothetical protein
MGWDDLSGILFCQCEEGFNPTTLAPGASSGEQSPIDKERHSSNCEEIVSYGATATLRRFAPRNDGNDKHTKTVAAGNRFADVPYDIHFTPITGL